MVDEAALAIAVDEAAAEVLHEVEGVLAVDEVLQEEVGEAVPVRRVVRG